MAIRLSYGITDLPTQQYQESLEDQPTKRARTNPYSQNISSRSSNAASNRNKSLRSVIFGSTSSSPQSDYPPILRALKAKQTTNEDGGILNSDVDFLATAAIDDDDDEDDLLSFIGLRK